MSRGHRQKGKGLSAGVTVTRRKKRPIRHVPLAKLVGKKEKSLEWQGRKRPGDINGAARY